MTLRCDVYLVEDDNGVEVGGTQDISLVVKGVPTHRDPSDGPPRLSRKRSPEVTCLDRGSDRWDESEGREGVSEASGVGFPGPGHRRRDGERVVGGSDRGPTDSLIPSLTLL